MSRLFLGTFATEGGLLGAAEAARTRGLRLVDAYTPYAVHGLDRAMGLAPSRLGRACLAFGLLGVAAAFGLQYWTSAVDWPLNVGGRPWNSWPAFVPVAFELMVLFAGIGVVLTFFAVSRLYPGRRAAMVAPGVTRDRFVLVVEEADATFDVEEVRRLFESHGAVATEERDESATPATETPRSAVRRNAILAALLLLTVVLNWTTGVDPSRPNLEFLPEMARSPAYSAYAKNPNFPDGATFQPPAPGTIPRGFLPLHYEKTEKDAKRAGEELRNPLKEDAALRGRGAALFQNYCAVCHGASGLGDGSVTAKANPPRGLPAISLVDEKTRAMKDGQLFHVLTYGQGAMASYAGQLSREDRWSVILHLRELQQRRPAPDTKGKP